ncbi:Hypothetical predicted protein [Cloeon dipterum]|nr:Hypothetical predicted protein [Cloeon dipterum]
MDSWKYSALYVTEDDEVFGMGENLNNGCFGTGDKVPHPEPKRIDVLCGKNIKGLEHSKEPSIYAIYAISSIGSVFAWGENSQGQLGLGTRKNTLIPTKITKTLVGKKVVQVACGTNHTLALTSDGQVFAFGSNYYGQLGLSNNIDKSIPAKVDGSLAGRFVIAIACQRNASLALLDSGEVFAWGWNKNNILALKVPNNDNQNIPLDVLRLEREMFSKIVCGLYHTLALSTDKKVYAWGNNSNGQIGDGTKNRVTIPTIISSAIGGVKDIAALSCASAALTETNEIYIWGFHGDQDILSPTINYLFTTLDEVFAPDICRPLRPKEDLSLSINMNDSQNMWLEHGFDDKETADFVFVVEGKKIHVHKIILILRCAFFKIMFLGDWKEKHLSEQTIEVYSFDAFYAFMKYFYFSELDVQPEKVLEVFCMAHYYQMNELQMKCERLITTIVTVENAAEIYEKAHELSAKSLEDFVFSFCLKNMAAVVESDNFKTLRDGVRRDFLQRAAEQGE